MATVSLKTSQFHQNALEQIDAALKSSEDDPTWSDEYSHEAKNLWYWQNTLNFFENAQDATETTANDLSLSYFKSLCQTQQLKRSLRLLKEETEGLD